MSSKTFKWVVEFEVDETWVADGFNMTDERAHAMLADNLQGAYNSEIGARVLKSPTAAKILRAQGYDPRSMTVAEQKAFLKGETE